MKNKSVARKIVHQLKDGTIIWRYKEVREQLLEELEKNNKTQKNGTKTNQNR